MSRPGSRGLGSRCALAALLFAAQCAWGQSAPERIRSLAEKYAHDSRATASSYDERKPGANVATTL
jgi:hypothetical protein